jgi:PAS domain S-box-containing protein
MKKTAPALRQPLARKRTSPTPGAARRENETRLPPEPADMGTFEWDVPRGRFKWSRGHEELWGFKPSEFRGSYQSFAERVHPDDRAGIDAEIRRCIATGEPFEREFRVVWPDGSEHWILGRGEFTFGCDGRPARMLGVAKDVTDRKRIESALRASELRFRALIEHSHDAILLFAADGTVQYTSPSTTRILGYLPDELNGRNALDFVRPDSLDAVRGWLGDALRSPGVAVPARAQVRHKDGEWRLLEGLFTNLLHEPGVGAIVNNFRDITASARMEQELRESEEKFSKAFHANPAMIVITTQDGKAVDFNRAYATFVGRPRAEMLGKSTTDLEIIDVEERQRLLDLIGRGGGAVHKAEISVRTRAGHVMHVLFSSEPMTLRGAPHRLTTALDITSRKRAEEALRDLARRLMEVEEVSRRDLARELHDRVGQNLTALNLNLSILKSLLPTPTESSTEERLDDSLSLVAETMDRVRNVMTDLRPPALDDYGLDAALRWLGDRFSRRSGVVVRVDSAEPALRLPPLVEAGLFRVTEEAITNVSRHAGARQVLITLVADPEVCLTIADDGSGFDLASLGGRQTWGLASMRERTEAVGGRLRIESAPGKGTTVIVQVPRTG